MADLTPKTRIEYYLAKANGQDVPVPPAATRLEMYLRKIAGEEQDVPTPVTRLEMFLAKIAGEDVTTPTPVTRLEMFLDKAAGGSYDDLVAVTRLEMWLDGIQGGETGEQKTASGTAPLSFTALAHALISLTQYGKVTQASTPTPSSPVDIVCNNGALRMVDDELPSGYKRVLGFTCNNNAMWEITGFNLKGSDTVRISFSVTAGCNVFGCYQGADANDNYDLYVSVSAGSKYLRYGNGTYLSYWSSDDLGQRFDVVYTPNGSQGMPQDSTWSPLTFTSANNLLIGSTTLTGTSSKLRGDLYGDIIVDGRLKLIPCERVSDGVLGYYDTYSETFYEPYEGYDGAVSLGYDGSHYSLATVGTAEVLSVSGAGASIIDNTIDGQGMGFNSTSTKHIYKLIPVGTVGKYVISVSDGYEAILRMKMGTSGSNITSWQQSQTYNFVSSNTQYCIAIRIGNGTDDLSPETFDGVVKLSPVVTQTASVADLFAVEGYADTQEIIGGTVTHKVGAYVFDGTEQLSTSTAYGSAILFSSAAARWGAVKNSTPLCTHCTGLAMTSSGTAAENTCFFNASGHFYFRTSMSKADFAAFLAEQYAAGTPIIVMFARATAATETVAGQHLTAAAGTNTVSVTSNVDPVTLEVVYMGEASDD